MAIGGERSALPSHSYLVWGLGLGFGVWVFGYRVLGTGVEAQGLGHRVRVWSFRVKESRSEV